MKAHKIRIEDTYLKHPEFTIGGWTMVEKFLPKFKSMYCSNNLEYGEIKVIFESVGQNLGGWTNLVARYHKKMDKLGNAGCSQLNANLLVHQPKGRGLVVNVALVWASMLPGTCCPPMAKAWSI